MLHEAFFVTSDGNEEFRPRQVTYETKSALEFSVEDELEQQKGLLTQKIEKLIPVSHEPRSKIPSIPVLVNAIIHLFAEKIPRSTIKKLVACYHRNPRCAQNNAQAAAYIVTCPYKETHEKGSLNEFTA